MHFYTAWQMESNGSWSLCSPSLQSAAWFRPSDWFCAAPAALCCYLEKARQREHTFFPCDFILTKSLWHTKLHVATSAALTNDLTLPQGTIKVWAGNLDSKYLLMWFFFFFHRLMQKIMSVCNISELLCNIWGFFSYQQLYVAQCLGWDLEIMAGNTPHNSKHFDNPQVFCR